MTAPIYIAPPPSPPGAPAIEPAEAIAIALTTALRRPFGPDHQAVTLVEAALHRCGWEIVPRKIKGERP